jgi:hypothetical protein
MASVYYSTFSELAKETGTYIVAGSIVLPGPYVSDGKLFVENKKTLSNVSFVFGPDGKIIGDPIFELYPNSSELKFISEPESKVVPSVEIPFAKTTILLGEDSWYPDLYKQANSSESEIILSTSFQTGINSMDSLWRGLTRKQIPDFINPEDINRLKTKDAWTKYSLPNQMRGHGKAFGFNIFLKGEFWELGSDGQPFVVFKDSVFTVSPAEKAGIWSLNF